MAQNHKTGILALGAGLLLIAIGLWQGELYQVLMKASIICLECIGIG